MSPTLAKMKSVALSLSSALTHSKRQEPGGVITSSYSSSTR